MIRKVKNISQRIYNFDGRDILPGEIGTVIIETDVFFEYIKNNKELELLPVKDE